MAAVLVDTNVLVYAHDASEPTKQARAIEVLDRLHTLGTGRLSVQCLGEFFSIATKARRPLLPVREACVQVERLLQSWPMVDLTPLIVAEAVRGVREHRLSYWDAQIWASARLTQTPLVFSEDFSDGSVLEGVRFVNPFTKTFTLQAWV
jgi:predicted nucleic acid-binding protein